MSLVLLQRRPLPLTLPLYPPQTNRDAQHARQKRDVVGLPVAQQALLAAAVPVRLHDGVRVEDGAVEEVEDVAAHHRRHGQAAPVNRKPI